MIKRMIFILILSLMALCVGATIPATFPYYFNDNGKIYFGYANNLDNSFELKKVDVKSFKVLNYIYAVDKKWVYCDGKIIDLSPKNLKVFYYYAIQNGKVFYKEKYLKKANGKILQTFYLPNSYKVFAWDDKHVYLNGEVTDYDPASFKPLENGYFVDKYNVSYENSNERRKIVGANPQDIAFKGKYLISNGNVYYEGWKLEDARADDVKLSGIFLVSNNNVYKGAWLSPYDAETYELLDSIAYPCLSDYHKYYRYLVRDKNAVYLDGFKLHVDAASFQVLTLKTFKDKYGVYFLTGKGYGTEEESVELKTLELDPGTTQVKAFDPGQGAFIICDNKNEYYYDFDCGGYLPRKAISTTK